MIQSHRSYRPLIFQTQRRKPNAWAAGWILAVCLLMGRAPIAIAQQGKPVQFSGLTLTSDSMSVVPFATILVKNRFKGTVSDLKGFFSMVLLPGDSLVFSAVGYRASTFVMPDRLDEKFYSVLVPMERDTVDLPAAVIYPWPSKEAFRQEFLALELKDDATSIARRNLEKDLLVQLASAMSMDASENQKLYMQKVIAQTYYAGGQQPFAQFGGPNAFPIPSTLLSPGAWTQFFQALRRGDFRRKD
ncbi:MAG: carboxypeptidase-like regulatory domain-containing protein [Bacteroidota bacterium]